MVELKYVIFDFSEIDKIDFNEVKETSIDTLKKSVDNTKTFVKYEGDMPDSVKTLSTKTKEFTHSEIIDILSTDEWAPKIEY
jgi:hypothetical protein